MFRYSRFKICAAVVVSVVVVVVVVIIVQLCTHKVGKLYLGIPAPRGCLGGGLCGLREAAVLGQVCPLQWACWGPALTCTVRGGDPGTAHRKGYCIAGKVFWSVWQMAGNKISLHFRSGLCWQPNDNIKL